MSRFYCLLFQKKGRLKSNIQQRQAPRVRQYAQYFIFIGLQSYVNKAKAQKIFLFPILFRTFATHFLQTNK